MLTNETKGSVLTRMVETDEINKVMYVNKMQCLANAVPAKLNVRQGGLHVKSEISTRRPINGAERNIT